MLESKYTDAVKLIKELQENNNNGGQKGQQTNTNSLNVRILDNHRKT